MVVGSHLGYCWHCSGVVLFCGLQLQRTLARVARDCLAGAVKLIAAVKCHVDEPALHQHRFAPVTRRACIMSAIILWHPRGTMRRSSASCLAAPDLRLSARPQCIAPHRECLVVPRVSNHNMGLSPATGVYVIPNTGACIASHRAHS